MCMGILSGFEAWPVTRVRCARCYRILQFEGYTEFLEILSLGKHELIKVNNIEKVMKKSHTEFKIIITVFSDS